LHMKELLEKQIGLATLSLIRREDTL